MIQNVQQDMPSSLVRPRSSAAGFAALIGLFFGLCAAIAFVVAIADEWVDVRHAQWPVVSAEIVEAGVEMFHPPPRSGGGTLYRLVATLRYASGGEVVVSRITSPGATRTSAARAAMDGWVSRHSHPMTAEVRVDPADAGNVELIDAEGMPARRHPREDLLLGVGFGAASLLLLSVARRGR